MADFIERYKKKEDKFYKISNELKFMEKYIGWEQLHRIYCEFVTSHKYGNGIAKLRNDYHEKFTNNSLINLTIGNVKYKIIIDFVADYGPGDCFPVGKVMQMITEEEAVVLREQLNVLEDLLFKNSIILYEGLSNIKKRTYPGLQSIKKIKPKNNVKDHYVYQYNDKTYKEHRIGFLVILDDSETGIIEKANKNKV